MSTVTLGQVARLAGVQRPSVSNWRRRHADFPQPIGGTPGEPTFDAEEIARWLDQRPTPPANAGETSYGDVFHAALRGTSQVGHGSDDFLEGALRLLAHRAASTQPARVEHDPTVLAEVDRLLASLGAAAAAEELSATAARGPMVGHPGRDSRSRVRTRQGTTG